METNQKLCVVIAKCFCCHSNWFAEIVLELVLKLALHQNWFNDFQRGTSGDFTVPDLSFVEALEAVADGEHLVALGDAHPDGGAHGRVHACRGGAHVQDGHVEVALRRTKEEVSPTGNTDASRTIGKISFVSVIPFRKGNSYVVRIHDTQSETSQTDDYGFQLQLSVSENVNIVTT